MKRMYCLDEPITDIKVKNEVATNRISAHQFVAEIGNIQTLFFKGSSVQSSYASGRESYIFFQVTDSTGAQHKIDLRADGIYFDNVKKVDFTA